MKGFEGRLFVGVRMVSILLVKILILILKLCFIFGL